MVWRAPTDAEAAAPIAARIDVGRTGGGVSCGVADPERAAPDIVDTAPEDQGLALRDRPHRVIRRGDAVRPLPPHARSLSDLTFEAGGARLGLGDHMARRRTVGLLVLKRGEVALERYGAGSGPEGLRTGYSVAKSMTSTLVGAALQDGAIGGMDDRCDLYLPRLRGSAYEGVTVRDAMRMCSGVAWNEEDDGQAERGRLHQALASRRPGSVVDLLRALPRARPQGAVFNYSTAESCLLGALVAAATGRPLADYCAGRIWGAAGMEADGHWMLESEGGLELGGVGLSARLRDVGRFGQLVLEDGEAFSGRRVLPPGWRDLAGQPDGAPTAFGRLMPGSRCGYGYQWWALPHGPTGVHAGAFFALGAFGQTSMSTRPSRWSSPSRVPGLGITTATPRPRPSRCSGQRCARSDRTRRRRLRRAACPEGGSGREGAVAASRRRCPLPAELG